jgi:hypothetical protein
MHAGSELNSKRCVFHIIQPNKVPSGIKTADGTGKTPLIQKELGKIGRQTISC